MNIEKIENTIQLLVTNLAEETFIYDFLLAYDQPKFSITRLKKGDYNLSKIPGEILWKNRLFFKIEMDSDLHDLIDKLESDPGIIKRHPLFRSGVNHVVKEINLYLANGRNIVVSKRTHPTAMLPKMTYGNKAGVSVQAL